MKNRWIYVMKDMTSVEYACGILCMIDIPLVSLSYELLAVEHLMSLSYVE